MLQWAQNIPVQFKYFEGFRNKREAADYSSTLYKSKGTKYSIEQFFRVFYNSFVEVKHTKENVFIVGNVHDLEKEKGHWCCFK